MMCNRKKKQKNIRVGLDVFHGCTFTNTLEKHLEKQLSKQPNAS